MQITPPHTHTPVLSKRSEAGIEVDQPRTPKLTALFLFKVSTFLLSTQSKMANQKGAAVDQRASAGS